MFPGNGPWGRRPGMTMDLRLPQPEPYIPTGPGNEDIGRMEEAHQGIERAQGEGRKYMMGASATGSRNPGSGTGGGAGGAGGGGGGAGGFSMIDDFSLTDPRKYITGTWKLIDVPGDPSKGIPPHTALQTPGLSAPAGKQQEERNKQRQEEFAANRAAGSPEQRERLAAAIAAKEAADKELAKARRTALIWGIVTGGFIVADLVLISAALVVSGAVAAVVGAAVSVWGFVTSTATLIWSSIVGAATAIGTWLSDKILSLSLWLYGNTLGRLGGYLSKLKWYRTYIYRPIPEGIRIFAINIMRHEGSRGHSLPHLQIEIWGIWTLRHIIGESWWKWTGGGF